MIDSLLALHFLRPGWLLVLPGLALLAWHLHRHAEQAAWKRLIAPHLLPHLIIRGEGRARRATSLPVLLAIACVAAAGPTWNREAPPFAERQAALLIGIDLSTGMNAADLGATRLERAKLKLHDLLQRRPGARHALLAYAGSAHLLLPPTADRQLFTLYLDSLQSELMPRQGRNTAAVLEAMEQLQSTSAEPYVRLLVTDDLEPAAIARLNASDTVVWAARADAGELRDQLDVTVVDMTLDDRDLARLERALALSLRQARNQDPALRWQDRGWWLLWPLALLLLLRLRRAAPLLALLPLLGTPPPAQAADFALWRLWRTPEQQAMVLFAEGKYRLAAQLFDNARWRGVAFYRAGAYAAALEEFERDSDAAAYYNQGNALMLLCRYREASERYRLALAQAPEWTAAQDNLELALQQASKPPDEEGAGEPTQPPDEVRFDLEKNRGVTASQLQSRETQARVWLDSLQTGPAQYLKGRMALQLQLQQRERQP